MKRSLVLIIAAIAAIFVGMLAPSYATNAPPTVSFKVTSGSPVSGAAVTLKARATDDGPPPLRYRWVVVSQPDGGGVTFGTAFSKARTASFTPAVAGDYEIKVIAKDASGRKGSKTKTVVVTSSQTMGNGIIETPEECDDADTDAGDGCSATGTVEEGFHCTGQPSGCSPIAGDGLIRGEEECDDSGSSSGDGCDATGVIEHAFYCSGEPSTCSTQVGDGLIGGMEQCDDGDTDSFDGCSPEGIVELGWHCTGEPSVCMPEPDARRGPIRWR